MKTRIPSETKQRTCVNAETDGGAAARGANSSLLCQELSRLTCSQRGKHTRTARRTRGWSSPAPAPGQTPWDFATGNGRWGMWWSQTPAPAGLGCPSPPGPAAVPDPRPAHPCTPPSPAFLLGIASCPFSAVGFPWMLTQHQWLPLPWWGPGEVFPMQPPNPVCLCLRPIQLFPRFRLDASRKGSSSRGC